LERAERLPVVPEQLVEQAASRRVGKGPEPCVHAAIIRAHLVPCQASPTWPCRRVAIGSRSPGGGLVLTREAGTDGNHQRLLDRDRVADLGLDAERRAVAV